MNPFRLPRLRGLLLSRPLLAAVAAVASATSLPAAVGVWNGGWPPISGSYNAGKDHNVPLSASVQEAPPAITLTFHKPDGYLVYRKLRDADGWGSPIATLPAGTASFTDTDVSVGVAYEYKVNLPVVFATPPSGYIMAGIRVDQTAPRGRLVLLVTQKIADGIPDELAAYVRDLGSEGWTVHTIVAPSGDYTGNGNLHQPLRAQIQALHAVYPGEIKNVVILGRVPVVRSGINDGYRPDNHYISYAEATDAYYAEMDGNWTDTRDNSAYATADYRATIDAVNIPGDGKFDASRVVDLGAGQKIEFGFGRVDLSVPQSDELAATKLYLAKLARYKRASADFQPGRRGAIRKGYDNVDETGWGALSSLVGPGNVLAITSTNDLPSDPTGRFDTDALATRADQRGPFLFYFKGFGHLDRLDEGSRAVFWSGMQSHWGYWADSGLGQMSGRLASDSYTLSFTWSIWAVRYLYHRLGLGGDMGDVLRTTLNNPNASYSSGAYPYSSANFGGGDKNGRLWISHIGDPTLRLFPVRPPTNLAAAPSGSDGVTLSWTASTDTNLLGVHLYRAPSPAGPWTRLTPAGSLYSENSYTDTPRAPGAWTYSVRAVKLESTACGTYLNPSLGATVTVDTASAAQPLAIATTSLPVSAWQTPSAIKLQAAGGNPPYAWSLASGSLPPGLSLAADGTISGTPTRGGITAQPVFRVADFRGATAQLAYELGVTHRRIVTVPADADSFTRTHSYATYNYGLETSLLVVKSTGLAPYNGDAHAFLRFVLPTLAANERLEAARLRFHLGDGTLASTNTTLTTSLLADSVDTWDEGTFSGSAVPTSTPPSTALTYGNRPIALNTAVPAVNLLRSFEVGSRVDVDVLPLCLDTLVNDPARLLGLRLNISTASALQIASREAPPAVRPAIEFEVTHAPLITLARPLYAAAHVPAGQGVALRASVTDDAAVSNTWTKLSGPGTATFANAAAPDTDVTFSAPGRYALNLASDDGVLVGNRRIDVQVAAPGDTSRTNGLVLHYRFDENSGSTAADTAPDSVAHPATLTPAATDGIQWAPAAGRFRGALQFTAAHSYVATPDEATLDNTSRLSVALWIKPSAASLDTNSRGLLAKRVTNNSQEAYTLYLNAGRVYIRFNGNNATRNTPQSVLVADRWTHIAAVFDGTQADTAERVKLYVDGVSIALAGTLEPDTAIANHNSPLWIGQMNGGNALYSFLGLIDDVRIYRDRALSVGDIADLFASEAPRLSITPPSGELLSGQAFPLVGTITDPGLATAPGSIATQWSKSAGAPAVAFATPASVSTQATATGGGTITLRLTADDGALATFVETSLTITASAPGYAAWSDAITWPGYADASASGDPDGDGLANLIEFALALDPLSANSAAHRPALSVAEGKLALSFTRDPALETISFEVQASADLTPDSWTTIARSTGGEATANVEGRSASITEAPAGELVRVTVVDATALSSVSRRFLRLHVVQP